MLRPRISPCLLIRGGGLVKTFKFKDEKYVGDPINAVRIFNEKQVDELIVLDIDATVLGKAPNFELIGKLANECQMPLCYGGGVKDASQAAKLVSLGVEKVAISSAAIEKPALVSECASEIGSQSVVVVMDVRRRKLLRQYQLATNNGNKIHKINPVSFAATAESLGAGEILVNCIDNDGQMAGYDLDISNKIREAVALPMTILGGAGSTEHMQELFERIGVAGAAAGSFFVFKGPYNAVLISYTRPQN